jgi:hypothetical protein
MLGAGYVLPPLGIFLMWRYGPWPVWLKSVVTVIGVSLAIVSSYISSTYVLPHVF